MRRTRVLLFLFVLIGTGLFAQSETTTTSLVGNETALQQIASLTEQSAKVNTAYVQLRASATSSRAVYSVGITALNDACNNYIAELQKVKSLNSSNVSILAAIEREIALTKKVQAQFCPAVK